MTEKRCTHEDGIEYWDLDVTQNEEVMVLQKDYTWKHFAGARFPIQEARFDGTPEQIAGAVQAVREKLDWGNHIVVQGSRCGTQGEGKVVFLLKMYATNIPHGEGPLQRIDRVILRVIGDILTRTAMDVEQVLVDLVSKNMTKAVCEQEDEAFLNRLEAAIKAVRLQEGK